MLFLFILESLGSTELLFILVMALVFFGPRKLPQISRSLGKSLAEFRRASDDFKRTWEREVAMESTRENSISGESESATQVDALPEPRIETLPSEHSVARDLRRQESEAFTDTTPAESLPKRDWL